jgi:hypothetical protein
MVPVEGHTPTGLKFLASPVDNDDGYRVIHSLILAVELMPQILCQFDA